GQTGRTAEADKERIQVRAFSTKVLRFQHEANVAEAAAARLRITKSVVDNPFVNSARFLEIRFCPNRDLFRSGFYDAICGQKFGWTKKVLQRILRFGSSLARGGQIHCDVSR